MADSPLVEQVRRLRQAQAKREAAELERLVKAFVSIHQAVQAKADALALKLAALDRTPTAGELQRLAQFKQTIETAEAELDKYRAFMEVQLKAASNEAVAFGETDARAMARTAAQMAGINVTFRTLSPDVIEQLVGFLDPKGPLYERLGRLPSVTAEQIADKLIVGVGMGKNPRTLAADITNTLGMGLTDSLRMTRTVQLWSYREANRASYVANGDVVGSWVWYAELEDACPACVAMHGSVHPLSEPLNDHHNGRCTMIPMLAGQESDIELGTDWFEQQSEEKQKEVLGESKFSAWKEGKFQMAEISGVTNDPVYGAMRVERSLKELSGGR
jgi:hypothetical protein